MVNADERKERIAAFAHLATMGLFLFAAWEMSPFLLFGGHETPQIGVAERTGEAIDRIPWLPVASVASVLPAIVEATRRIPRSVGVPKIVKGSWQVPIGKTWWGRWVYHDFGGVTPHAIVAGSTKFGKTAFLKLVLYILCQQQGPDDLQVIIIDMKGGASFEQFKWLPHVQEVYRNLEEADRALRQVEEEMWHRLELIRQAKMQFRKTPKWPRILVVIDEGMVMADEKETMKRLRSIASISREPGIGLIYGTQRPSHEILPVTTRDQMEARFVFHLNEDSSSEVVLGNRNAFDMKRRRGRMIYWGLNGQVECQASHVEDTLLESWLQAYADKVTVPVDRAVTLSIDVEPADWG